MADSAEQDNRVRFPDGAAAVCAEGRIMVKTSHWELSREGDPAASYSLEHESEDLRIGFFPSLRAYGGVLVAEKRLRCFLQAPQLICV